jgi:ATP synthase protein I
MTPGRIVANSAELFESIGLYSRPGTGAFLDSPFRNHYGPRGFEDGRNIPDLRATARASKAGLKHMAEDARGESKPGNRSAEEAALSARLQRLGERLDQQQGASRKAETGSGPRSDPSAIARGFRLSTELVAGVLVGAFIGWALDKWLGISPWGMIVFLLLGFAAGVINVMRAAGLSKGPGQGKR